MIKELYLKYKEIILYIIVGGMTTVINWIIYTICTKTLPIANTEKLVLYSNAIACGLALIFAYITNKIFVFESKTNSMAELLKEIASFVGARLATGVIDVFGVPVLVYFGLNQTFFGIEGFVAKIVISVLVVILNYILSKLFIFKNNTAGK